MKGVYGIGMVALLGLAGCGEKPREIAAGFGSFGYDRTTVTFGSWGEGTAILVWADADGTGGGGATTTPEGARYRGRVKIGDREHLEWECTTADGKTGSVKVNGIAFELANGALFLVGTKANPIEVHQIQRDLSHIKPTRESLDALVKIDKQVAKFVAAAQNP